MLLQTVFIVTPGRSGLEDVDLPLTVQVDADTSISLNKDENGFRLVEQRRVDPSHLELVRESGWSQELPDGTSKPGRRLRLVDDRSDRLRAQEFANAVTFLTDIALSLSRPPSEDRFIPEGGDDEAFLARSETNEPYYPRSRARSSRGRATAGRCGRACDRRNRKTWPPARRGDIGACHQVKPPALRSFASRGHQEFRPLACPWGVTKLRLPLWGVYAASSQKRSPYREP
jgi:hypothetical protein